MTVELTVKRQRPLNIDVGKTCYCTKHNGFVINLILYLFRLYILFNTLRAVQCVVTNVTTELWNKTSKNNYDEYKQPHFEAGHSVIVHLFEWKFSDVAKECEDFLGPNGFGGVRLSAVTEHSLVHTEQFERPWWENYQPISYDIQSRAGNENDLRDMVRICNAAGVRVYIDVVLNHMAGLLNDTATEEFLGSAGNMANSTSLDYPAVPYTSVDFHVPCQIMEFSDAHEVRNCQLNGQPDLDHSKESVHKSIVTFLNKLIEMGVAGFYINAAKYMWPVDLKNIYNSLDDLNDVEFGFTENSRPFIMQDVFDVGMDSVSKTEYAGYGLVTEYMYALEMAFIFNGQSPLISLLNTGPALGFLPSMDTVIFVDLRAAIYNSTDLTHFRILSFKHRSKYIMANAFMLAHPYGNIRQLMSSYDFNETNFDAGPPTIAVDDGEDTAEELRSPEFDEHKQCVAESGWICEHRWKPIVQMVALANSLDNQQDGVTNFQTNGPHQIAFCRGYKAFIAINNDRKLSYEGELHTCLPAGTYCDIISGGIDANNEKNCLGKSIIVNDEGNAQISLAPAEDVNFIEDLPASSSNVEAKDTDYGVMAIYLGSKLR